MFRLHRSSSDAKLAGICGGLAEIMSVDATIVRLGMVLVALLTAVIPFVFVYFIGWWVIPVGDAIHNKVKPPGAKKALSTQDVIDGLRLKPHPLEGGYFVETYRAEERIPAHILPGRYGSERDLGTAIYYLLSQESCSKLHKLASDEIYHFYGGDPTVMLLLMPDGTSDVLTLGNNLAAREHPQIIVEKGVWQGAYVQQKGEYTLMGTTMAPGYDQADYTAADAEELLRLYPDRRELILKLT